MKATTEKITVHWKQQELRIATRKRVGGAKAKWIVALHGLQSTKSVFDPLFAHPDFADYSILAIDLVGFGESDGPNAFTYDLPDQASTVLGVLDACGIDKFAIVGHSLGGMVGTLLLNVAPERVTALVSLEGNLTVADCGDSLKMSQLTFEEFSENYVAGKAKGGYAYFHTAQAIVQWSRGRELDAIFRTAPLRKLLLIGSRSRFHSRPTGESITIQSIPDATHFLLGDQPAATLKAIAAWGI